jgi:hypothetical protein
MMPSFVFSSSNVTRLPQDELIDRSWGEKSFHASQAPSLSPLVLEAPKSACEPPPELDEDRL